MVVHLKRIVIVLALLCMAPLAQADLQRLQTLHEFRSEGYITGTYLLIDNNLYERVREPGNRETYNQALTRMDQLLRQLGNPNELRSPYTDFVNLIRELEGQPEEEAHFNLATVNRIMQAHGRLERTAAQLYDEQTSSASEQLLALHQQSLETNQILLLYQNNMFSSVGVYFMDADEGIFAAMDQRITERASKLHSLFPDQQATLSRLDKQYTFIQPRLIKYYEDWVPTIAAFYLQRNIQTLDMLAREQVRVANQSS